MNTNHTNRVVVLVDMDCFYCQVEEELNPRLKGKPIAVVQYNQWRGGGIIAVNYPARDRGVTRHMRGNEAKKKCPEIELVRVPNIRGKADLTKYREAGKRVAEVLQTFTSLLERASVDEAYMDITESVEKRLTHMINKLTINSLPNTHVVGISTPDFIHNIYGNEFDNDGSDLKLLIGGAIVEEIRAAVYERTGYRCSAGIAHNKILAKLVCGLHKPNKQTILPQNSVDDLFKKLPINKIRSLGGKFGVSVAEDLNINYMGDLLQFSLRDLNKKFDEKTATWLYNISRGIDPEPVTVRLVSKSIGCCKKFPGHTSLKKIQDVTHWVSELSTEIAERLEQDVEENNRKAKQMVLSFAQPINKKDIHTSKTLNLNSYEPSKIANDALETLKKMAQKSDGSFCLTFLGISVGKFEDMKKNQNDISTFFKTKIESTQDILMFLKANKSDTLNVDDIEDDAENDEINLNDTLKDMENIKSVFDPEDEEDSYSNTTIEMDYTSHLENKEEFPNFTETPKKEIIDTSKSFFIKYLNNPEKQKTIFTPPSAIDQQLAGCSYEYVPKNEPKNEIVCQDSNSSSNFDDLESNCPECNKKINHIDYVSHMDHHLAEKLMAEEREIFQQEFQAKKNQIQQSTQNKIKSKISNNNNNNNNNNNKAIKRKPIDSKNLSITSFLTPQNDDKENSEMQKCPDCDKRIRIDEFACHLDYHAAKKLHLELNPVKSETQITPKSKSIANKNSCKKSSGITTSISNYFKSVEN